MIRNRPLATLLAAAILVLAPAMASAQDTILSPEGTTWKLTSYAPDGDIIPVPFGVSATLLLLAGQASGSGGCNTFSGTYQLAGPSLTFGDDVSQTFKLCVDEDVQAVEEAYLAALPRVAGWTLIGNALQLSDGQGRILLTFEVPAIGLTSSEMAGLIATLQGLQDGFASLRQEVRRLNVDRLRERVRALEATAEELRDQVSSLEETSGPGTEGNGFTQAEGILLEGIPTRIASTCLPARSGLPAGTLAALQCQPNTTTVSTLVYYLMEGEDAAAAFADDMATFNVPEASSASATCATGTKSQRRYVGGGWQAEGCYRTGGRAEVRFVDNATDCRQLRAAGQRMLNPAIYMTLQGSDGDVAGVHQWATRSVGSASPQITSITQLIERPNAPVSPGCPT